MYFSFILMFTFGRVSNEKRRDEFFCLFKYFLNIDPINSNTFVPSKAGRDDLFISIASTSSFYHCFEIQKK